jgi:MFS family permease
MLSVPLLAFAGHWQIAALLIVLERAGRGVRTPVRDTLLSVATKEIGPGKVFGIHEAFDQTGAALGPLLIAFAIYLRGDYRQSYLFLIIPALLTCITLILTKSKSPTVPQLTDSALENKTKKYPKDYWLFVIAIGFVAAAYADYPLIAYHFHKARIISPALIPIFYAITMGVDGIAALILGNLFDRRGTSILISIFILTALYSPLVFLGNASFSLVGMVLWGIGLAAQESVVRAVIATMIPAHKRGTAFGIFNTVYGLCWFGGSILIGFLYSFSMPLLIMFSVIAQLAAIPFLFKMKRDVPVAT